MRATSPQDPLQFMGDIVELPEPPYAIGTRIDIKKLAPSDRQYYGRTILRSILRKTRAILDQLQAEGYLNDMVGKKMLPGNKAQLREMLDVLMHPDAVELAGMSPQGMHVTGNVANQCYLQYGPGHSGVSYCYYLLFRKLVNGNKVVYIHPEPVIRAEYLRDLVVATPVAPAVAVPT
jgi:hypothetical protein